MNFKKAKLAIGLSLLILLPNLSNAQNEAYEAGQKAMHAQQYEKAYEYFKKAEPAKGYSDAAIYWQAYVLYKNNQDAKARRTVENLLKNHPNSKWVDDAEFLIIENELNHSSPEQMEMLKIKLEEARHVQNLEHIQGIELNEELKLFAIQHLMFQDESKGLAQLKKLLTNTQDIQTKLNALEVLGINESKQATKELYEFARQNQQQALQQQAIQMLSIRNSKESQNFLLDLYKSNNDKQLKSSIIEGFIHSNDPKKFLKLIESESDMDLSRQMIELLGVMGAKDELKAISKTLKGRKNQEALINAMAISGDTQAIKELIENSKDLETQSRAIQSLIILDDKNIGTYLSSLYKNVDHNKLKHEIISVMGVTQSNPNEIVKMFKAEPGKELKARLIESLMVMDAKQALLTLQKDEKDPDISLQIIQMLGIMGASSELKVMHKSSDSPEFQIKVINSLAIDHSGNHTEFLNKTYDTGNSEVKNAVINAYMIKEDTPALVTLLKLEKDRDIKKQILRTISMFDPEYILNRLEKSNNGEQQ